MVLSQLQALRKILHQHVKSRLVQSTYNFTLRENAFAVTLSPSVRSDLTISLSILQVWVGFYKEHGNRYHTPHNRMPFVDIQAILQFLKNPATTYATSLPGRLPGHKHKALPLQSHMTKDLYTISMLRHVLMMVATYQLDKVYSLVGASH